MTHYERMRAALDRKSLDRLPVDFQAEEIVWERLETYFQTADRDTILDRLGVERRTVGACYIGPPLQSFQDGSYEIIVSGGPRNKALPVSGGYSVESTVFYPWADVEEIADLQGRWGWNGKKEWWDFSAISKQIDKLEKRGRYWITAHGDPSGLQHVCMWMGDEHFLMALASDEELAVAVIEKHNEIRLWHALQTLEAGGGRIHELNGGGDYGAQKGMLISPDMFRRLFKPIYARFYREIKQNFDVEIFFHSCGAIAPIIPDLIEVGVTILDPIQSSASGMDIPVLKEKYGHHLCFHGGLDVQSFLPYATPEQVREKVRENSRTLGREGGYIIAPTHNIQPDTPLDNILAIYTTSGAGKGE